MSKKRLHKFFEQEKYLAILIQISEGNNYLQKISNILGLNSSNTLKKIRFLESQDLLKHKIEGNKNIFPFEIKRYFITDKGKNVLDISLEVMAFQKKICSLRNKLLGELEK